VTGLQENQIKVIENAIINESDEGGKLRPVYESLDGQYDYGVIRCVQAAMSV
jgi:ATP-dependent DNA helicase RecQ